MVDMESHRKKLKRGHEPGHFHELTFSCYRQKPLLANDAWRRELAGLIDAACVEAEFDLNAFVFMPEHIHLLIYWKWSSARFYLTGILDKGLPRITKPLPDLFESGGLQSANY